ncbi:MAG: helix-turn-helix transcriptional regulator [Actinomycetota bacterium]|nr:helix-turn-helix transcriptional regulator [Actinomycetota bacterium]
MTSKATSSTGAPRVPKPKREEPQGGLPRNYLRASLLLLIGEAPVHGYDLLEQIAGLGLHTVDAGGLYRALRVMEGDGLVASTWEHSASGPARRTYRLTVEGGEWLHVWAGALRETHRYLSSYLDRYDDIVRSPDAELPNTVLSDAVLPTAEVPK